MLLSLHILFVGVEFHIYCIRESCLLHNRTPAVFARTPQVSKSVEEVLQETLSLLVAIEDEDTQPSRQVSLRCTNAFPLYYADAWGSLSLPNAYLPLCLFHLSQRRFSHAPMHTHIGCSNLTLASRCAIVESPPGQWRHGTTADGIGPTSMLLHAQLKKSLLTFCSYCC